MEQLLAKNGPMTLDQMLASADFAASSRDALEKVLEIHSDEFRALDDGRIWLINAPLPETAAFDEIQDALEFGLAAFHGEATVEELRRILCLATVKGVPITRLDISRGLEARPDTFMQIQRGRYAKAEVDGLAIAAKATSGQSDWEDAEKPFNAEIFFGGAFSFADE
jgi:hypothetical protein